MPALRRLRPLLLAVVLLATFFIGRFSVRPPHAVAHPAPAAVSAPSMTTAPSAALVALAADASDRATHARRAAQLGGSLSAEDERQRTLEKWAETDPRGALDFARTKLKGDRQAQAVSSIIAIWGGHDPAAAWAWVGTEMPTATHHFDTLLEVFGKNSTDLAKRYATEYATAHPEAAVEVNLAALLGVTYRGDFGGALGYIEGVASADPSVRANLTNFLAGQWARYDPVAARDWVLSLPEGPQRAQALVGLGESWAELEPSAAAAFASTLPEGESRSLAMRQAVAKWVETDPLAARQWVIGTNAYQDFDAAVEAVATQNNFMHREPANAFTWASGIFNEELRLKTMNTVLFTWYAMDRPSALASLASSPDLTVDQRAELLRRLVQAD